MKPIAYRETNQQSGTLIMKKSEFCVANAKWYLLGQIGSNAYKNAAVHIYAYIGTYIYLYIYFYIHLHIIYSIYELFINVHLALCISSFVLYI